LNKLLYRCLRQKKKDKINALAIKKASNNMQSRFLDATTINISGKEASNLSDIEKLVVL